MDAEKHIAPEAASTDDAFIARLHAIVDIVGGASGLARKAGISPSGLSRYLSGGEPSRRVLVALADAAGVRVDWLATGTGPMHDSDAARLPGSTLRLLPLLTPHETEPTASARPAGHDFTAQAFCYKWLNDNGLDSTTLTVMQVRGDGMSPTLRGGDTILIDMHAREIEDGRIYVLRDSGNLLIRRLHVEAGNSVRALTDNPQYREFARDAGEIDIVGRVVWRGSIL
ncbi:LexA family transcriptional regulator [Bradyrhizobium sp.]|uniref:LexA family transcriptional regulator n=1 Tax=Bradyrhizobium sp. TaxID=376 RepID=UPI0039E3C355